MSVNSPEQLPSPRTLDQCAAVILQVLGVPVADQARSRQVKTFITCNGYEGVLRAAGYTALRATKETITDPWAYTIGAYNGNLARLSHLYVLIHWVESGLRSQLNLYYMEATGPAWHRFPERYLPRNSVTEFLTAHANLGIKAVYVRPGDAARQIEQPESPAEFLDRVTLGWLVRMVLSVHKSHPTRILVPRAGHARVLPSQVQALLDSAKEARNTVAHNRYMTNERYERYHAQLLTLLDVLHFDVAKALSRSEDARSRLIRRHLGKLTSPQP